MPRLQFGTIATLLISILVVQALPLLAPSRTAPTYEYRIEDVPDGSFDAIMDKHGAGGWDLVFARRALNEGKNGEYEMIFRRPK